MLLTEYIETCLIEKLDYNELNNVCIEDIVPVIPDSSNSYWCTKNIRRYKSAFMFYLDDQKDFYKESELHKDNKEIHKKWAGEPKDIKLKRLQKRTSLEETGKPPFTLNICKFINAIKIKKDH